MSDPSDYNVCDEHEAVYLKGGYCLECRIVELESNVTQREADRIAIAIIRDKKASKARRRIAELEAKAIKQKEAWDQHTRQRVFVSADDCPYCRIAKLEDWASVEVVNWKRQITERDKRIEALEEKIKKSKEAWDQHMQVAIGNAGEIVQQERQIEKLRNLQCRLYNSGYHAGHHDTVEGMYTDIYPVDMDSYHDDLVAEIVADAAQEAGE
jgi:hypothetical protein